MTANDMYNIQWDVTGISLIDLQYSFDDINWTTIVDDYDAAIGEYNFEIPNVLGDIWFKIIGGGVSYSIHCIIEDEMLYGTTLQTELTISEATLPINPTFFNTELTITEGAI